MRPVIFRLSPQPEPEPGPEPEPPATGPPVGVVLDWSLWCTRHLKPYMSRWPEGAAVAMVRLFDAAVHMKAVADYCHGNTDRLTEALHRFAPLCCFVPYEQLQAIYAETVPRPDGGSSS